MLPEIRRLQKILKRIQWLGRRNFSQSKLLNALSPFNYMSMGSIQNLGGFSGAFRHKILEPMFINFIMATNVLDMPASLFARYLEIFNIEHATPMQTWDQETPRIYNALSSGFQDKVYLS